MAEDRELIDTISIDDDVSVDRSTSISNQPQATQFLCDRCQEIFQNDAWHIQPEPNHAKRSFGTEDHHRAYDSLINSVIQGCYICVLLWERIPQDAKKALPTLYGDNALSILCYNIQLSDESRSRHVQFYINPVHNLALGTLGTDIVSVSLNSLPTNGWRQYEPTVDAGAFTNSSAAWTCIARWLENCSKHHTSCGHPDQSPYASQYPTRLLDIGDNYSGDYKIKLVETNAVVPEGPYITLSHCWGRGHITSLTKANVKQFLLKVPALPKTFRDAITVARKLHVRYLWIDSLCIIQDDADDWRTESMLMGQVYKNALLNVAATAASDSCGGLFYARPHLVPCFQVQLGEEKVRFVDTSQFTAEVVNAPLLQRAWVLQERFLAPRVLHFGRKQLFWECNESCASETFPDGLPPGASQNTKQQFHHRISAIAPKSGLITKEQEKEVLEIWRSILVLYTSSNLTFGTDKLPALSGIVKHIQPLFGKPYLAGMWKDSIILLLGWYCFRVEWRPILPRPVEYRAPTWSWASTDNPITFWLPFTRSETVFDLKILAFETSTTGDDPAGHVTDGFLLVEGPLNLVTVDKSSVSLHGKRITSLIGDGYPPWLDEDTDQKADLYTLPLHHTVVPQNRFPGEYDNYFSSSVYDESIYLISFLLVKPRTGHFGSYTRCGVWRSDGAEKLLRVENGHEAPCEEFIGLERGHRIRIY